MNDIDLIAPLADCTYDLDTCILTMPSARYGESPIGSREKTWQNNWIAELTGPHSRWTFTRLKLKPRPETTSITMPEYQLKPGGVYDIQTSERAYELATVEGLVKLTKREVFERLGLPQYVTQSIICQRPGWTVPKVKRLLGDPDKLGGTAGTPYRLYDLARVVATEQQIIHK